MTVVTPILEIPTNYSMSRRFFWHASKLTRPLWILKTNILCGKELT